MQILLIGCGKMGSAMLSAWLEKGLLTRAVIVDRHSNDIQRRFSAHASQIEVYADIAHLPADIEPGLVVLAVKPQQMGQMLSELAPHLNPAWPVMTLAAGWRIQDYATHLPHNTVIRAMPNIPVILGKGMTIAVAPHALPPVLQQAVENLLRATGDFFCLETEDQLDAATAISGSGPAYFFYLAEQLAKAGAATGLTVEQTNRLARQTLIGAGYLAEAQTEKSFTELLQNVTSPGGVTLAALTAWENANAFPDLVAAGIAANIQRSKELAQN